jgi:hypothetical protein
MTVDSPVPSMELPVCPTCAKQMRLKGFRPSETYPVVRHFVFVCDCGVVTDLMDCRSSLASLAE